MFTSLQYFSDLNQPKVKVILDRNVSSCEKLKTNNFVSRINLTILKDSNKI